MRKIAVSASFAVALLLLTVSLYAFTKSPLVHAAAAATCGAFSRLIHQSSGNQSPLQ
jgi:hypothetical protein